MDINYANLPERIKAAFIDAMIMILAMYAVTEVFAMIENVPNYVRAITWVFIFFLYEPIFVSSLGWTVGHSYLGLVVRRDDDPSKKINFFVAMLRVFVKWLLGWVSLVTTTGNSKRKAIHDIVAFSVVLRED